jgi:hypothetical protein
MPVPSAITDLSTTLASNSPAGSDNVFPDLDNYLRAHAQFVALLRDGRGLSTEVSLASAATCDIGGAASMFVQITGTTTITSFGTNYLPRVLRFAGALTLTHNATTLILPTGANITTAAGDMCLAVPVGTSGWRVLLYTAAALVTGTPATSTGFWPDVTSTTKISRMRDRVFIGGGAAFTGNFSGSQGGFLPTNADGHPWAVRDAAMLVASDEGLMQVVGYVSNENQSTAVGQPDESIGVSGFCIGNNATLPTWAGYFDVQFEAGTYGYGLEIAVKNKKADETSTPYFPTTGTYGIWLQSGAGEGAGTGGSAVAPCNTAIAIGKNGQTWNKGVVFFCDGLTGSDGTTGTATAIEMGKGHRIVWRAPGNLTGFSIRSDISAASSDVSLTVSNNIATWYGTGGSAAILDIAHTSSAVNWIRVASNITGAAPTLQALGSDTNVDLRLLPKGTGRVVFGYSSTGATTPANFSAARYLPIKDSSGNTYYIPLATATW